MVTLTFSYSRGGEAGRLHTLKMGTNQFLIGADREAVEVAKSIVTHQDVILDKLENVRWFFARIRDVGDSVKEVSRRSAFIRTPF